MLVSLGAWLGAVVGHALGRGARAVKLGVLDRVLGAIGNLLVTAFVVALVGSGLSALGVPVLSPAIASSRVLSTLDQLTPAPARTLLAELRIPAVETTSCGFAGWGLNRLYVTSATENWTDERRRAEPGAGLVYRFETDATGLPSAPFRPDPEWWAEVMAS